MANNKLQSLRIPPEVERELHARGAEPSVVLRRDIQRYYELLRRQRRELVALLAPEEQALIADVSNGTRYVDPVSVSLLWAEVEDGIRLEGLAGKWGVDGIDLVKKLRALDYPASATLVDAAERFWNRVGSGEQQQPDPKRLLEDPPTSLPLPVDDAA